MAGLLDFIQALREGADWAKRDIQKIGADPVASAKGAGTGFVKGVSTDLLGMPVDTGVNLYNLGKAGVGTVGGLFGMRPENLPALTEKKDVPGSSEWLEEQVRKRGGGQFIDAPQGSSEIASLLGNVIAPGPKGAKAPQKLEVMTYHGTPHQFDRYDLSKIGTGEGAQVYGHGMYFAENPAVAREYATKLASAESDAAWDVLGPIMRKHNIPGDFSPGTSPHTAAANLLQSGAKFTDAEQESINKLVRTYLYKQDLPDEVLPRMLQWDKPLSEQPKKVKDALKSYRFPDVATGEQIYDAIKTRAMSAQEPWQRKGMHEYGPDAAFTFQSLGIPGVSYLDQGSRTAGAGTRNHVIWDQSLLDRMLPQRVE